MKKFFVRNCERGDTIVEVLIAVAVVSSVLAGAFTVTQKSATATRDAQEHSEAQKIAETQLESLRAASENAATDGPVLTATSSFCMNGTTVVTAAAQCVFQSDGKPAASGVEPAYKVSVTRANCLPLPAEPCGVFRVGISGDSVTSSGQGAVDMTYRLYGNSAP